MGSWLLKCIYPLATFKYPVVRYASLSRQGIQHVADNIPNQDLASGFLLPDLCRYKRNVLTTASFNSFVCTPGIFMAAVFDGHGTRGDEASTIAAKRMEFAVERLLKDHIDMGTEEVVRRAFREVAAAMDLASCGKDSGTTGTVAVVKEGELVFGSVGDSKGILVSRNRWGRYKVKYSSPMHRPTVDAERERVEQAGGVIKDGYVVDSKAENGIAVSRTLGDRDMRKYGCISEPEVRHFRLQREDYVVLLASDGFWDHDGLLVGDVLKSCQRGCGSAAGICRKLMEAVSKYGEPRDDCTMACLTID